jgi:hypothetical protein
VIRNVQFVFLLAICGFVHTAVAQNADDYRGGWRTDKGEAHTYEFSIRGDKVRGIYCTYCADATTLAFVDGTFGPDGITFMVTHVNADGGTAYQDSATARFDHGNLIVTGVSGARLGAGKFERTLIKDPRGPDPLPIIVSRLPKAPPVPAVAINQQGVGAPLPRYIQPGPWKSTLTEKDVIGVWLGFGVGAPKQYFVIRKVGNKLRGMVCGTCDNPYTMAALDDFEIQGDLLKFNILHEDWGDGELPTFYKHVTAHVGWNELRCTTTADHQPPPPPRARPPGFVPGFSLTGPIAIEATAGNRWLEWPPPNTSIPENPVGPLVSANSDYSSARESLVERYLTSDASEKIELYTRETKDSIVLRFRTFDNWTASAYFDVNHNHKIDSHVDVAYDGTDGDLCAFYLIDENTTTTCGSLISSATVEVHNERGGWVSTTLTIPKIEISVDSISASLIIAGYNAKTSEQIQHSFNETVNIPFRVR